MLGPFKLRGSGSTLAKDGRMKRLLKYGTGILVKGGEMDGREAGKGSGEE